MQLPLLFLLACGLVAALPLRLPAFLNRQGFLSIGSHLIAPPSTPYLERVSRSAELLFTASDDDEMFHVWLPLGERLHTSDHPALPLHPASAKIVHVLGVSTETGAKSNQQQVTCIIKTRANGSQHGGQVELDVAFQEGDGVVRLNGASSAYDLTGREVDSYECF